MADEQTPAPGNQPESNQNQEGGSLEGGDSGQSASPAEQIPAKKRAGRSLFQRYSLYLLLFVLVIVIAIIVVVVSFLKNGNKQTGQVSNQTLSQSSVDQLAQSDVTVGDVKQTLNVQSNAVFAGQVLVRKDVQIAGKLDIGGPLSLTAISVSGDALLAQANISKNLAVSGDGAIQGQLSVQKNLSVNGGGSFNGAVTAPQISANTLQLNGDLNLTHHISAGGANPGRTVGNGLGAGGSASVSGSDTAGSITISTGSGPVAGCFVSVTFTTKFNTTPHVVVTPVEAAAGSLQYYVTRTTAGFSVCTANAAPAGQTFGFDYIIFD